MVLMAQFRTCELRGHEKKNRKVSPTLSTSKSQVRKCGVNFRKIKNFGFMILKAQVRTCELLGHEKKKRFPPTPSTSKSQVQTCSVNFRKIKIFVSMVLKAQVWTCELCDHKKKKILQLTRHQSHRSGPVASIFEKSKF